MKHSDTDIEQYIKALNMAGLTSHQKFSLAKDYDGKSELLLDKFIDDNCTLDFPTDNGPVTVSILAVLLENENIQGDLKDKLIQASSDSEDPEVKVRLAKDERTPLSIQKKLAKDDNGDIRVELVWRKQPEISILKILSQDINWAVRREVAKSKYSTPDILKSFINDTDDEVVLAAITNKNITLDIVNKFAEKFFSQDGWYNPEGDKYDIGSNIKLLKEIVYKVFNSNLSYEELVSNNILNSIAKHDQEYYRLILAKPSSFSVPGEIMKALYRKGDEFTSTYLSGYDTSGEELLLSFAKDEDSSPIILMNLSNSQINSVRAAVAQNHNTLEIILKKLSFDSSKVVRKAAKTALRTRQQEQEKNISDNLSDMKN